MRRALVALTLAPLLALTLPACLSGFSEIRIVRPDAGAVDAARADALAPADAPQSPSDALDAPTVPDGQAKPLDAAEVAVPVDVVMGLDAQDAGAVVDAPDVPRDDLQDVGELADRPDALTDAGHVDVFDVQCPTPLCGGRCVDTSSDPANCGMCGRACASGCMNGRCVEPTRFIGAIFFADPAVYDSPPGAVAAWEIQCALRFSGARLCRRADLEGSALLAEVCAAVLPPRFGRSYGLAGLGDPATPFPGTSRPYYACAECQSGGGGMVAGCHVPYAIACCSQ